MTPLDLIYDVRLRGDDLGGDTGTPSSGYRYYWEENDAGCLWKNAELLRYLNQAHNELALRTSCYRDGAETEICRIAVTAGSNQYTIDPRILTIEDVLLNSTGLSLTKTTLDDYRATADSLTTTGTPTQYLEHNRPFRITLYPIPVVNDILLLTVYRLPLEEMTWATRNTELDEPPEFLRESLIQGALSYAYQKRDADTSDGGRQQFHAREFERLVGPAVDYKTLEARRWNANLNISVRPYPYMTNRNARSWMDETA